MKFSTFLKIAKAGDVKLAAINAGLTKPGKLVAGTIAHTLSKCPAKDGTYLTKREILTIMAKAANPNTQLNSWNLPVTRTALHTNAA